MKAVRRGSATIAVVIVLVLVFALSGCSSGPPPRTQKANSGGKVVIVLKNDQFDPSNGNAPLNSEVVFQNADSVEHHIVVGTADLGTVAPGASVSWQATPAGIYNLKCTIHPSMVGQLTVGTPPAGSAPIGTPGGSSAPPGGTGY